MDREPKYLIKIVGEWPYNFDDVYADSYGDAIPKAFTYKSKYKTVYIPWRFIVYIEIEDLT